MHVCTKGPRFLSMGWAFASLLNKLAELHHSERRWPPYTTRSHQMDGWPQRSEQVSARRRKNNNTISLTLPILAALRLAIGSLPQLTVTQILFQRLSILPFVLQHAYKRHR